MTKVHDTGKIWRVKKYDIFWGGGYTKDASVDCFYFLARKHDMEGN